MIRLDRTVVKVLAKWQEYVAKAFPPHQVVKIFGSHVIESTEVLLEGEVREGEEARAALHQQPAAIPDLGDDVPCIACRAAQVRQCCHEKPDHFLFRNFGGVLFMDSAGNIHKEPPLGWCVQQTDRSPFIEFGTVPLVEHRDAL